MTRTGSCIRCGACCRNIAFEVDASDPAVLEWLQARRLTVDGVCRVILPHRCPQLGPLDYCRLHEAGKPEICRNYPTGPEDLLPGCGFSFEEE